MLNWFRFKQDLQNGVRLLKMGLLNAAVEGSQEGERVRLRFSIEAADRQLAESYQALGKWALTSLHAERPLHSNDPEWIALIREIDTKRAELDRVVSQLKELEVDEAPEVR